MAKVDRDSEGGRQRHGAEDGGDGHDVGRRRRMGIFVKAERFHSHAQQRSEAMYTDKATPWQRELSVRGYRMPNASVIGNIL